MEREKVIELAKKAGFDVSTTAGVLQLGIDTRDDWFSCREEVLELIRLVEQETLERAARVAEKRELHDGDFLKNSDPRITIADAIRNLKDNHDKE